MRRSSVPFFPNGIADIGDITNTTAQANTTVAGRSGTNLPIVFRSDAGAGPMGRGPVDSWCFAAESVPPRDPNMRHRGLLRS